VQVWHFILKKSDAGTSVILLYVLDSTGSSPGRQGFHMAVAEDGEMCGSIGGGIMEHKFVEMAKQTFDAVPVKATFRQVHNKLAAMDQSGMICSGEQTIFLHRITENDSIAIRTMCADADKEQYGTLQLCNTGISYSAIRISQPYVFEPAADAFTFKVKTGPEYELHIIGGGHCSLALSQLMKALDFYVYVYDERAGLNTMEQSTAHKKIIVPSYESIGEYISVKPNVYVVIMTQGYRTDDIALKQLLDKQVAYIGVLGSKNKMSELFRQYKSQGISEEKLERIHTPIGISINSRTPMEIAVSIAAEIIAIKNK
jgi:xanthine dehydrogenase accessory factor